MERDSIVCSCLNITAGMIEDAVKEGADTLDKVQEKTGAGTVCGVCIEDIEEIIKNCKENA